MYSQVGTEVGGAKLTMEEYVRVEKSYVEAAVGLLAECGVQSVAIDALEHNGRHQAQSFDLVEGQPLSGESLREALRSLLRGDFWCRLMDGERAYIHVGWDYYMYVGVPCAGLSSIEEAQKAGLFIEPFESPYKHLDR